MHHRSSRPLLALLILILASLACGGKIEEPITKGNLVCKPIDVSESYIDYINKEYDCSCKNGENVDNNYRRAQLEQMTEEEQIRLCGAPNTNSAPQPTEPPTEDPAATEPPTDPAPLKPYLTGAFTTCDNVAGYVNFTIAEDAPAYDPATFKVTFNGYPVNCAPAANNPSVLTCNYPPPSYAPPAGVQVFIGEELVNEFDFNGGEICNPVQPPNTNNNGEEQPAPTEAPTEEPTPTEPTD